MRIVSESSSARHLGPTSGLRQQHMLGRVVGACCILLFLASTEPGRSPSSFLSPHTHQPKNMQGLASTPAPRRTVYKRAASQELPPPPVTRRRSLVPSGSRPGGSKQYLRLGTPSRALERPHSNRDGTGSAQEGMDVDQDAADEIIVERGLKFETIFAKSDQLQVTFYAHLPTEVKLLLRNAGVYFVVNMY